MEKVLHIILSLCLTILFVLTINLARDMGDIIINNISLLFMGLGFFTVLLVINIFFAIRK